PTAEGVLRDIAAREAPQLITTVDSAGTAGYHVGEPPDPRSVAIARERGYELSALRARQVSRSDFEQFDLMLAMDRANLAALRALAPARSPARLALFMHYAGVGAGDEVPDPYYGERGDFERVLDLVEQGGRALLAHLSEQARHR
ncbi:MAG: low molecular weight phosphotyrosine protein phosphatase, partial [Cypionkella sp.]|nr:low molecular weight phosphotyrosine protein phosphatase [Cypionkella sp.]